MLRLSMLHLCQMGGKLKSLLQPLASFVLDALYLKLSANGHEIDVMIIIVIVGVECEKKPKLF